MGQAAHHVQPECAGGRQVQAGETLDPLVGLGDGVVPHPQALVDHGDGVAVVHEVAQHPDPGVGGREVRGVLHQLGQQVGDVGHRPGLDRHRRQLGPIDPGVGLDLRQSGADDVVHRALTLHRAGTLGAGQHEQVLGVAPHAGGQVVEAEQPVEGLGIGLGLLQLGDDLKRAGEQAVIAAAQVLEDLAQVASGAGVAVEQVGGGVDQGVERVGGQVELAGGIELDRRQRGGLLLQVGALQRAGHLVGRPGEPVDRAHDGPHHEGRQHQRDQRERHQRQQQKAVALLGAAGGTTLEGRRLPLHQRHGRHHAAPVLEVDGEQDLFQHVVAGLGAVAPDVGLHRRVEVAPDLGVEVGGALEGVVVEEPGDLGLGRVVQVEAGDPPVVSRHVVLLVLGHLLAQILVGGVVGGLRQQLGREVRLHDVVRRRKDVGPQVVALGHFVVLGPADADLFQGPQGQQGEQQRRHHRNADGQS